VAVDIANRVGWYAWHLDLFDSLKELFETETKTMTICIPHGNHLNESGWQSIRTDLHQHFKALQRALWTDAMVPYLMATVNNIARVVGNLIRLGSSAPPEPPITQREGAALLLEQMELRSLTDSVRSLLSRVARGSDANKQISFWLTSFEKIADTAHPSLRHLPPCGHDISADFQLVVNIERLLEARPRLVTAAVDLIRLLTSRQPQATRDETDPV
jgi:hypothetical protein